MGRPLFNPTTALRRKVSIAAGGGMSHEEIAIGIGVSRNTLEKHFESELSAGAYERRLEVLCAMHRVAKAGNVAAQKAYMQMTPHVAAPPASAPSPSLVISPALGKKQQASLDAKTAQAGTEWSELLRPAATVQ